MAVSTITESALVLTFDGGFDANSQAVFLSKLFRNIKPAASYDGLLAIAQKLEPLQQHAMVTVERDDKVKITA
ncbi:DUF1659 domain-containing protein [Sporolactobacillus sp. THM7-4]|nr:DUF1659 domain-containing protein [Sporolactobacillus sp. THM7-4]